MQTDGGSWKPSPTFEWEPGSIHTIVVHGLLRDNTGANAPLPIGKGDCQSVRMAKELNGSAIDAKRHSVYMNRAENLRRKHASAAPADRSEIHLRIVSDFLHENSRHVVYRVSVDIAKSSPRASQLGLPSMIIKIATELEGRTIAAEAVMYEHLFGLQGTVIPQCYGYFRSFINLQEYVVTAWSPGYAFPRNMESFDIFRMPNTCASLNVLLLEDVGDRIPPALFSKEQKAETLHTLQNLNDELCYLGIRHHDLRYSNVLQTAIRRGPSPKHKEIYKYRIIDLENTAVTGRREEELRQLARNEINEILGTIQAKAHGY
ncbi:hypothetical protein FOMPIDRAFT_1042122 [Fomitopsis schrenkii]|uniref:Protein kinase domain-containing protein n=1 Tax=Fomitopsis schrenkii TaxID=2126942 RepID=S8E254_FOMSC|nr:hypothetical protein FOMPIDRAFT_1042122 [Fomitopsis schrenkii]